MKAFMMGIALAMISGATMAAGNLKLNIISTGNQKAVVTITNSALSVYEVEIKNEEGDVMFYKRTNSPGSFYKKTYDFSELNNGTYTLTASVENEKVVNLLNIDKGNVAVMDQEKIVDPIFTLENNTLKLSYLNFAQENLLIHVYESNTHRLLFEKELKPDFAVHYGLNLSNLKNGKYDVVLAVDNRFFKYKVTLD